MLLRSFLKISNHKLNMQQSFNILGQWLAKVTHQYSPEKVHIKDPLLLAEKIARINQDGPEHLQIVTDFDQTITTFESPATFSIFRMSDISPQQFRTNMQALYDHYVPIEKDQSISLEEKNKHMAEWYHKVSQEFAKAQFTKVTVAEILNNAHIQFRYLFEPFFTECFKRQIPFHIVSGGIDQVIHTILASVLPINEYADLTIKTNVMTFQEDVLTQMEMLVTATTKANILQESGIAFRKNTLLLGDLPSDFYMTKYVNLPNQVAIGFLDEKHQEYLQIQIRRLEEYTKLYDITLVGDPSYLVPLMLLNNACKDQASEECVKLFNQPEYEAIRKAI